MMTRNPPAPVPLPRKRSLRHQFPTRHAPRPRRLERRGDMPPALDPTQYHPAIDNVSAGALHRKVRSSSSRRSLVVTIVPPSVTRPSRGVRPSLPTSTPARSAHQTRNSSQAYDDYKRNVASNEPDDPSASASASADEEDAKRYGTIHPRVWSKDPHGGAYKISSGPGASGGYDALAQRPDGTVIAVEPGYERPAIGPTTNFVGNHMTQGAIDLAQGELTRADPDADRRRERLDFARGTTREPPQLLSKMTVRIDDEHANRHRSSRPVERYAWRDAPDSIVVTVRVADLPDGADVAAAVATFESTRFALDVPLPDGSKATLTIHLSGEIEPSRCFHTRDANRGEIRARLVKSSSSAGAWRRFARMRRRRRFSPTRRTTLARRRRLPTSPRFEGDSSNSARDASPRVFPGASRVQNPKTPSPRQPRTDQISRRRARRRRRRRRRGGSRESRRSLRNRRVVHARARARERLRTRERRRRRARVGRARARAGEPRHARRRSRRSLSRHRARRARRPRRVHVRVRARSMRVASRATRRRVGGFRVGVASESVVRPGV